MSSLFSATEWKNSHLEITFHDPATSNAFGLPAAREFSGLIKSYKKWPLPVVVRGGHPRVFCSGGQLADYAKLKGKAPGLKINREITSILDAFGNWPVPKLALVEGDVFGGGLEWLARFDFRWSLPSALIGFWQARIGLSPGWGGGRVWASKIGEDQLRRLLMEARLLSADECVRLGIVDRVVTRWNSAAAVTAWAREVHSHLVDWSGARESKVFSDLWMGPKHQAVLKRWK